MIKVCTSCGKPKDEPDFYKGKRRCKACQNEWTKEYNKAHPEKQRERMRKYRETHPEYVKRELTYAREYGAKYQKERLSYQLERQASNKQLVNTYKDKPCTDCGVKYPPYVMDFDHIRGKKLGNVSSMCNNRPVATILAEIEKCDLVCANCHRIRTHNRY